MTNWTPFAVVMEPDFCTGKESAQPLLARALQQVDSTAAVDVPAMAARIVDARKNFMVDTTKFEQVMCIEDRSLISRVG